MTAFQLFSGFTNNTLPPYSPIRLGVKIEKVIPTKIALYDFQKDKFSKSLISACHFKVSNAQLIGIKMTVKMSQ